MTVFVSRIFATPRSLLRLLTIVRVCLKYRLDRFTHNNHRNTALQVGLTALRMCLVPFSARSYRHHNQHQCLRLALEELGPIFIKFGQLLSTRVDLFSAKTIAELSQLQDKVAPFASDQARNIIETTLAAPIEQLFTQFDSTPMASASIAQVYGATIPNGDKVVVKVVRPNIVGVIERDIMLMGLIARCMTRLWPRAAKLHLTEVVRNYHKTIIGELDMEREAASCSQLARNFSGSTLLFVPKIYWKWCGPKVLTQERIDGIAVNDTATMDALGIDRKILATKGVEIFFTQVFEHSFFHADMHPGNIFVLKNSAADPRYVGIDFGIMGSLSEEDQYYLAMNLLAFLNQDYRQVARLHVESGWVGKDTRIEELETAVRTVCEPIFSLPIKEISFGKIITRLFQTAREFDMEVQPQLLLLQKTIFHIEGLGRQLYPDLNLWETAKPFLERWLKNRSGPKRLINQMRLQAPYWIESLPQLPRVVQNTNKQLQHIPIALAAHHKQLTRLTRSQKRTNIVLAVLTLVCFATAVAAFVFSIPGLLAGVLALMAL